MRAHDRFLPSSIFVCAWSRPEARCPLPGSRAVLGAQSFGHRSLFRRHAHAEKKCAASPGGTFFILIADPRAVTHGAPINCAASPDLERKTCW